MNESNHPLNLEFLKSLRLKIRKGSASRWQLSADDIAEIEAVVLAIIWERLSADPFDSTVAKMTRSKSYLNKWINFRIVDWLRKNCRVSSALEPLDQHDFEIPGHTDAFDQVVAYTDFLNVIQKLKPRMRLWLQHILFAHFEDISDDEMASMLKISPSTYSYRKDQVLKEIESLLRQ